MMKKRCFALLIFLCFSVMLLPAFAADETGNLVINGDFETVKGDNAAGWTFNSGTTTLITDDVHSGKYAIKMEHTENMYISQMLKPVANEKYKVSFWAKTAKENTGKTVQAAMKLEGYDNSRQNNSNMTQAFDLTSKWKEYSFEYTAADEVAHVNMLVRLFNGGAICWDDIKVEGKLPEGFSESSEYKVEKNAQSIPADGVQAAIDGKELFINGSFEEGSETAPKDWNAIGGKWEENQYVTYDKTVAHTGSASVKISTQSGGNPWACQLVRDLIPGATYQLTGWYNSNVATAGIICKFEFYSDNRIAGDCSLNSTTTLQYGATNGAWKQMIANVTMPDTGIAVAIYPRLLAASGTVYFDDMSLVLVKYPPLTSLKTDNVFYYSEYKEGTALLTLDTKIGAEYSGGSASFKITDETGKIYKEASGVQFAQGEYAKFAFEIGFMELKKEYTLIAELHDAAGALIETQKQFIYKYNRPTAIGEDGIYRVDGKPFYPTIVYHAGTSFKELSEIGVNVVQGSNYPLEQYIKILDEANKYGMKILITLYPNMAPAGSEINAQHTKTIVEGVKNHPAVFAYAVQDEPFANNPNCQDDLRKSYKLIRDIDPVHPIYLVECFDNYFEESGKYVDVLCVDPYPTSASNVGTRVTAATEAARKAVNYKKPVYVLSSVFTFGSFRPDGHEIRTQFYETLFAGGVWGMYPYNPDNAAIDVVLPKSDFWPHLQSFYSKESKLLEEYFYLKAYPNFNKGDGDGYKYESFVKDGDVYMMVYNETRDAKTVTIPLVSQNGKVKPEGCTISIVNGSDSQNALQSGNNLNVNLSETQAVLYKITPSVKVDTALLSETAFADISEYSWATEAISALEKKDITNSLADYTFGPGENITRADFAMFLIKTLGLTMSSGKNFNDIDTDAYYAESIAIGRTLGILNGVGNNNYNPESSITRQDLMTIIARGMGLTGDTDLSSFSDSGNIADYALSGVKAMIASGLVKGNSDGTLNPQGKATRAEAAVIMSRIMGMK